MAGTVRLTSAGRIVRGTLESLPARFCNVVIDTFVVMPDHVHGILWLCDDDRVGLEQAPPLSTLSNVMPAFKSISAHRINTALRRNGGSVWQRSFYDRVIRTERELDAAHEYIVNNPLALALKSHEFPGVPLRAGGASPAPTRRPNLCRR